jgi:hypothetical protein
MAIQYAFPRLEPEFQGVHPLVKSLIEQLQTHSEDIGFPDVVVTHVWRTKTQQKAIYMSVATVILKKINNDNTLTESESDILERVEQISDSQKITLEKAFERWAEARFSWHMARTAIDLRNRHYTSKQRAGVMAFLRARIAKGEWELLEHDIGRGDHIHLAKRDAEWKAKHVT